MGTKKARVEVTVGEDQKNFPSWIRERYGSMEIWSLLGVGGEETPEGKVWERDLG
jgi:hypothetical protein